MAWALQPSAHPGRANVPSGGGPSTGALRRCWCCWAGTRWCWPRRSRRTGSSGPSIRGPRRGSSRPRRTGCWGWRLARRRWPGLRPGSSPTSGILAELTSLEAVAGFEQGALRLDVQMTNGLSERGAERVARVLKGWKDAFAIDEQLVARLLAEAASVERDGPTSLKLRLRTAGEAARKIANALLG